MKRVLPYTSFTVAMFLLVLCVAAQALTPDNEGKEVFPLLSICIFCIYIYFLINVYSVYFFISLQFILFQTGGKMDIYAFSII